MSTICMRVGTFTNQLSGDVAYKAFIPNKLPFEVKMDSDLQSLLSQADLALGRLDGVADILPEKKLLYLVKLKELKQLLSMCLRQMPK